MILKIGKREGFDIFFAKKRWICNEGGDKIKRVEIFFSDEIAFHFINLGEGH